MKDKSKEPTKVYVCSPYRPVSADPEERKREIAANRKRVKNACKLLIVCGYLPMAPHLYFTQFLSDDEPEQREEGMQLSLEWLSICDELWTFGNRISEGMQTEIDFAKENYIRIHNMPEPETLAAKLYNGLKKQFENNEREVFYL